MNKKWKESFFSLIRKTFEVGWDNSQTLLFTSFIFRSLSFSMLMPIRNKILYIYQKWRNVSGYGWLFRRKSTLKYERTNRVQYNFAHISDIVDWKEIKMKIARRFFFSFLTPLLYPYILGNLKLMRQLWIRIIQKKKNDAKKREGLRKR